jgi:hypothetical protein
MAKTTLLSDDQLDARLNAYMSKRNEFADTEIEFESDDLGNFLYPATEPKPKSADVYAIDAVVAGGIYGGLGHLLFGWAFWSNALGFSVIYGLITYFTDKYKVVKR